jgi:putative phosphoribosyl transferase
MMASASARFRDRRHAGYVLAGRLQHLAERNPLVLALPRGGVPVGFEVARALYAELDLLMVRKIGAPGYPEFGIGAVIDGARPHMVLNEPLIARLGVGRDYLIAERHAQLREIERRRNLYRGDRPAPDATGRTVIIVDDGIATGGTVRAALQGLKECHPLRSVLAVPVCSREAAAELSGECDEFVCLMTPDPFYAVGAHYIEFDQTTDDEVIDLLHQADKLRAASV